MFDSNCQRDGTRFNVSLCETLVFWIENSKDLLESPVCSFDMLTLHVHGSFVAHRISYRGRGLGRTSQINWMIWNLPQREEIESKQAYDSVLY